MYLIKNEVFPVSVLQNYRRPVNIVAMINLIAFALLYFYQESPDRLILWAGALMLGMVYLGNVLMIKLRYEDEILFLIVSMLTTLGMIVMYRLDPALGFRQLVWFLLGNGLLFGTALIYRKFRFGPGVIYFCPALSFVLFSLTLLFGSRIKGATNWIVIGGFSFQPSEIIKLLFVLFMAAYYRYPDKLTIHDLTLLGKKMTLKSRYVFTLLVYLHMGFLAMQKELGTLLLFFFVYMILFYVFDGNVKFLCLNGGLAALGALLGVVFVRYVQIRVETWLHPWADVAGKGYQITQSLFGIGAGGFFGTGIGLGRPEYIPEVHTDFIFSAICEEMGIFGGIAVILLYFILVYRGIKITLTVKDFFHKAVALGITVLFGFQSFIIIGGVINMIPLTGITLPFISYGGSSLVTSFMALGILQGISSLRSEQKEEVADAAEAE